MQTRKTDLRLYCGIGPNSYRVRIFMAEKASSHGDRIFGTIGSVALHTDEMFKDRLVQFPAFAETQRHAVPGKWAWLDRELADDRAFLAGDDFSVADITGGVASWLGEFFGMEIPATLPNVRRWNDRVRQRPSWNA